jgi:hypothetical protein
MLNTYSRIICTGRGIYPRPTGARQNNSTATGGKYTMITNLSSAMYINSVIVPPDALRWTDTNGVSGFDVTIGTTHYRYVEGHIEPLQLNLYAPYLYIEENIFE